MKKSLLSMWVVLALAGLLWTPVTYAQTGFALSLPGAPNGANSNMKLPALNSKITGYPFTIEMWVKPSGWVSYGGFFSDRPGISATGATGVGNNATNLQFDNNATNHYVRCDYDGNSRIIPAATLANALCNNGVWNHISMIVKADSTILELNGVYYKIGYAAKTWNPNFCNGVSTYIGWDNTTFAGQTARAVPGLFDEIRIWNTARTQAEIDGNKSVVLKGDEPGLVAYYNFDDKTTKDKTVNGFNGVATGATIKDPNSPVMSYSEKNVVLEIEPTQPYPLFVSASALIYNIVATPSAGIGIVKNSYTPADFTASKGRISFDIYTTTLNVGDTGKVVISYSLGGKLFALDSVRVTPVPTYERYFIINKGANKVIGNNATAVNVPGLTDKLDINNDSVYTQFFILRPVHPAVNDSLYYIEQDGTYRMLRKGSNDWDTEFGSSGNETIWKLYPQPNGTTKINSIVTGRSLGVSALTTDTRLVDNLTFKADPTSAPYCEWILKSWTASNDATTADLTSISLSNGLLKEDFDPAVTDYHVLLPVDVASATVTGTAKSDLEVIDNNVGILTATEPAVLTCYSGDNNTTKKYKFSYSPIPFESWAANGETNASRSVPSQWGWKCNNVTWTSANSTTAGTVRYIDKPAKYYTLGDTLNTGMLKDTIKFTGRALYMRWDGVITTSAAYSYPVALKGNKSYVFTGKYAWNSVVPTPVVSADTTAIFTFGINSAADNSGTGVAQVEATVKSTDLLHLHTVTMNFIPPTDGVYYFTVKNNMGIMGAVADLSISEITALPATLSHNLFVSINGNSVMLNGTNAGDQIRVYTVSGQQIKQLNATGNITSFNLNNHGVYVIRCNSDILKIVK